eukprot:scaffold23349_cov154-Amphora_coffeaeformis.AAC.1
MIRLVVKHLQSYGFGVIMFHLFLTLASLLVTFGLLQGHGNGAVDCFLFGHVPVDTRHPV